jgi:hypothetical protein
MDWNTGLNDTFSDFLTKRNLFLLVLFWLGGLSLLVAYGALSHRPGQCTASPMSTSALQENETGAFTARRRESSVNRPAYEVAFDDLHAEDGGSGPFRTAAHKIVYIENLRVRFLHTPQIGGLDADAKIQLGDLCSLFAPRRRNGLTDGGLGLVQELWGAEGDVSASIDLTNTMQVRIKGLEWEICRNGQALFSARCRHARLEDDSDHIVLRGHATVTANGTTLESNCIALDVRTNRIVVDGRYILTRDGQKEFGAGASFNTELKTLGAAS